MAGGGGPIDRLPLEMIQRILYFCHIEDVVDAVSVNKKWKAAVCFELQKRPSLALCLQKSTDDDEDEELERIPILDTYIIPKKKNFHLPKILNLMTNLRKLYVTLLPPNSSRKIHDLIRDNASSLESLYFCGFDIPNGSAAYQRLTTLSCTNLDSETARCCPAIKNLTVHGRDSGRAQNLIDAMSCFTNLQNVALVVINVRKWQNSEHFLHLFEGLTNLVEVNLILTLNDMSFDQMVARLVRQNAGIQKLYLCNLKLTDAAMSYISRLKQLQSVGLREAIPTTDDKITTDGCIQLLRGRSRNVLQKVDIDVYGGSFDRTRIEAEVQAMSLETGLRYEFPDNFNESGRIHFIVADI